MIFTGDCLFEGGVGMFFEGNATQMNEILRRMFLEKITSNHEECALFFGHDYGWKNYLWAADYLFGDKVLPLKTPSFISDYKKLVVERKD